MDRIEDLTVDTGTSTPVGREPLPQHVDDLRRSGLTDETIRACGFWSCSDPVEIQRMLRWKGPADCLGPCLVIPFPKADGTADDYTRVKPDTPLTGAKGKPRKYESPKGHANRVFFPPRTRAVLRDTETALIVTEGEKKSAAADQHGFPCLGLVGVYGWQQRREAGANGRKTGPKTLIPDLLAVAWTGRRVFIVFDSDAASNRHVRRAERELAAALRQAGAIVVVVRLPGGPEGTKQGLDDFLVARGPDALRTLLDTAAAPAPPQEKDYGAALFRDAGRLAELADLKLEAPALFEAERADLKKRGVSPRSLDEALAPLVAERRSERRVAAAVDPTQVPYFIRDNVTFRVTATRDGPVEVGLGNFAATITAVVTRDDGAETTRAFTLVGRTAAGIDLPPVDVPADQFAGMGWIAGAWGNRPVVYAGSGTKDHLRVATQLLSGNAAERTVYAHLGWRLVRGKWVFLHAGGAIGTDGTVEVGLDEALAGYVLPTPPTGKSLVDAVQAALRILDADAPLAPDAVSVPLFGAVWRAALGTCDFGLHLFGRTGVMKSELAALAQQHFGAGLDARHLPANWMSTANAIEGAAFAAKDALLVVDDFNPTGAIDPQKLHAVADRVFRGAGNGAGRNRMGADLTLRPPRPPRALILSTGEDIPRGHSLRARVPVVEVSKDDVNTNRLSACQRDAAAGVYAGAMAGFITWLAPNYSAIRTGLANERANARDAFAADSPHARTPAAVGDLWLGWEYITRFAVEIGAIKTGARHQFLDRVRAALRGLAAAQADHLIAADPVEQFLRLVPAVIASGQAYLAARTGGAAPEEPELFGWRKVGGELRAQGIQIGWLDAASVYLIPDAAFAEVQSLATSLREPITMSPRTLWARLHERRLLSAVDDRGGKVRHTVRLRFGSERVTCLQLARTTLFPAAADVAVEPKPLETASSQSMPGPLAEWPREWPQEWPRASQDSAKESDERGHWGHSTPEERGATEYF